MRNEVAWSPCRRYRYWLRHTITGNQPRLIVNPRNDRMVICMLNPSTADEQKLDPTVTRCAKFAAREGMGVLDVLNLYALRSTDPAALWKHRDPVGPDNDTWIAKIVDDAPLVVVAWGATPARIPGGPERSASVLRRIAQNASVPVHCLGRTAGGYPRHPLYLRRDAKLSVFEAA